MTNSVSFGRKIPLFKFQIYNNKNKVFEPAIFSELDCKDLKDFSDIETTKGRFFFKEQFIQNMWNKRNKKNEFYDNVHFYTTETEKGNLTGICETYSSNFFTDITFISSEREKLQYKYSGQTILASIGKMMSGEFNFNRLIVSKPLGSAFKFYRDICGFDKIYSGKNQFYFSMDKEKIKKFIGTVEKRIHSEIRNI